MPALTLRLRQEYSLDEELMQRIEQLAQVRKFEDKNILALFLALGKDELSLWFALRKLKKEYSASRHVARSFLKAMLRTAREKARTQRRILVLDRMQQIFHYWHVIHKPFAFIMIIVMFIHIIVAVSFGYKWIL